MPKRECPICKSKLIEARTPEWDKEICMYAKSFYRFDKCCADITVDHGVVTMTDKSGKVMLSGK